MKIPKKIYLVAAILLFIAGGVTTLVLQPQPEAPKTVAVEQVSSKKTVEVEAAATEVVEAQPAAVEQPVVTPEEPPVVPEESLKDEIKRKVEERSARYELDAEKQFLCLDMLITKNGTYDGYNDETRTAQLVDAQLHERANGDGGTTVNYFGSGCSTHTKTVY